MVPTGPDEVEGSISNVSTHHAVTHAILFVEFIPRNPNQFFKGKVGEVMGPHANWMNFSKLFFFKSKAKNTKTTTVLLLFSCNWSNLRMMKWQLNNIIDF